MKYQHKPYFVEAQKIVGRGEFLPDGSVRVLLEGHAANGDGTVVLKSQMPGGLPKVGDYFVTGENAERSVVPKAVFEASHEPLPQGVPIEAPQGVDTQQDGAGAEGENDGPAPEEGPEQDASDHAEAEAD